MKVKATTSTKMTTVAKPMEGSMVMSILAREGMMVHRDRKAKKPLDLEKSRWMLGGIRPALRQMMPSTMQTMDMLIKLRGLAPAISKDLKNLPRSSAMATAVTPMARQMKLV